MNAAIDPRLIGAMTLHQRGDFGAAEPLYRAVLAADPLQRDATQLLATLLAQRGAPDLAIALFDRAIALDPGHAVVHCNRGNTLRALGRSAEALAAYEAALTLQPDYPEALSYRANVLHEQGRLEEALSGHARALALQPTFIDALINQGATLTGLGRHSEALASLDKALKLAPRNPEAWFNRGLTLAAMEAPERALASFSQAIQLRPEFAEAWHRQGLTELALRRFPQALASLERALALRPHDLQFQAGCATALAATRRFDDALAVYDRLLAAQPEDSDLHNARGNVLFRLGRFSDALAAYQRASALRPDSVDALGNCALALAACGDTRAALAVSAQAAALAPERPEIRFHQALWQLQLGDYAAGWPDYEYRHQRPGHARTARPLKQPLWLGQASVAGKTVLLHCEQGFGDTLQFCRYVRHVRQLGATVILELPEPLAALLQTLAGVDQLVVRGQPLPPFDFHCPLPSLPLALGVTLDRLSGQAYLQPDAATVERWRAQLGPRTDRRRIGLAWSGNPDHENDRQRSLTLDALRPLLASDCDWYVIQRDIRPADLVTLDRLPGLHRLDHQLTDFGETAALLQQLDLVISVDTSVAHLAGALGVPVWILVPVNPDWRWLRERDDSPWYDSVRLFRQQRPGEWGAVLGQVAAELGARIRPADHAPPASSAAADPRPRHADHARST